MTTREAQPVPDIVRANQAHEQSKVHKTQRRSVVLFFVAVLGLLNAIFIAMAPSDADPWILVAASGILWASALPCYIYYYQKVRRIPFIQGMAIAYFFYYGLPVFIDSIHVRGRRYIRDEATTATALALMGELLLFVAFYTPAGALVDRAPKLRLRVNIRRAVPWYLFGSTVTLLATVQAYYVNLPGSIAAIVGLVGRLPLVLLAGTYLLYLRGQLRQGEAIYSAGCYAAFLLIALGKGTLAAIMMAVAPFIFIYIMERGRVPYKAMILSAVLLVPFLATKHEFRRQTWDREDMSMVDRTSTFVRITWDALSSGGLSFFDDAVQTSADRTSYLGTLAYVVEVTPNRVPYWNGETYKNMAWSFIPRMFAPDKPKKELGQAFGHRYRLLQRNDRETSYNFAQLVEMYANFGPWGIGIGMLLVGLFYRMLYSVINHREGGDGPVIIAAVLLAVQLNIESDASLVLLGVPQAMVVYIAALLAIQWVTTPRDAHAA